MKRRSNKLTTVVTLMLVAAGLAGLLAIWRVPQDARVERLAARLQADAEAYHAWGPARRPVLHGEPRDCNAAEAQLEAAAPLASITIPEGALEGAMERGPPERMLKMAGEHAEALSGYREAARCDHAWTDVAVEQGLGAPIPEYVPAIRAGKLVLLRALAGDASACLRAGADVLRLAHDLIPGATLVGAMVASSIVPSATKVIARCAHEASPAALRRAVEELDRLRRTEPDLGGAFEVEALFSSAVFRKVTTEVPWVPTSRAELQAWWNRPEVLDAWELSGREPARFREMTTEGYPGSAEIWGDEVRARMASGNRLLVSTPQSFEKYIRKHMAAVAELRAAIALLRILAESPALQELPERPLVLERPELYDPFTGTPLLSTEREARTGCIHAVGPDREDDGCAPDSDDPRALLRLDALAAAPAGGADDEAEAVAGRDAARGRDDGDLAGGETDPAAD